MDVLIRKAKIIDPNSAHQGQQMDILIENGKISKIAPTIQADRISEIKSDNIHVSIGWIDVGVQIGDPGMEHREDLQSAAAAASRGGYTGLVCYPNTNPVVHTKSGVLYIKQNTLQSLVDFYPIGAVSENCKGQDITEMIDMHKAGAVAFSDGKYPIQDNGLMMRALLYMKAFSGVVINQPRDITIAPSGQINEGVVSTSLGIGGIPNMAEEIMIQRDIYLAEYTDSRLHIANVSTAGGVEMIKRAKAKGLKITASVAAINLAFTDSAIHGFDSNFKVLPPLRSKEDVEALKQGLKDGTLDLINSNHVPLEKEAKELEFAYAKFGVIGLETTFAVANTHLAKVIEIDSLVQHLAYNTRKLINIDTPCIKQGEMANLTIFDPELEWIFQESDIRSKSRNTPFVGQKIKGRVLGVVNNQQVVLHS